MGKDRARKRHLSFGKISGLFIKLRFFFEFFLFFFLPLCIIVIILDTGIQAELFARFVL